MSLKELVRAAYEGNPSQFEKIFESVVATKLSEAIESKRRSVVAEMLDIDLAAQELTEEEYELIAEALSDLDEEDLITVSEMEVLEAAEFINEQFKKGEKLVRDNTKTAAKRGALSGAVRGAAAGAVGGGMVGGPAGAAVGAAGGAAVGAAANAVRHVVDHGINKGAKAVGRGVKRVAKAMVGRK